MKKKTSKSGYVLISVLSLSVLLFILGSSALYMTQMGSQTLSSDLQYKKAKFAADYGINEAIKKLNEEKVCGTADTRVSNRTVVSDKDTKYSFSTIRGDKNCLIYSIGKFSTSKVIRTAVVPIATDAVSSVTNPNSGNLGAMTSKGIQGLNMQGSSTVVDVNNSNAIVNQCGDKAIVSGSQPTGNNFINRVVTSSTSGNNAIKIDNTITTASLYNTLFKSDSGVSNYSSMKEKVRDSVISQAASNQVGCSFVPLKIANGENTSRNTNNTNCNMNGTIIECNDQDRNPQQVKIDTSKCSKVVLYAGNINLKTMPANNPTIVANSTGNFDIQGSVSGFFSSEANLNVSNNSGQKSEGIFVATNASNSNIGGQLNGLLFVTNSSGNVSTNINTNSGGKISGAIVVDGNINNTSQNGRTEFNPENITKWSNVIPGLLNEFGCGGATTDNPTQTVKVSEIEKSGYLQKTKMFMF